MQERNLYNKYLTFGGSLEFVGFLLSLPLPRLEEAAEGVQAGLAYYGRGQAATPQAVAARHAVSLLA